MTAPPRGNDPESETRCPDCELTTGHLGDCEIVRARILADAISAAYERGKAESAARVAEVEKALEESARLCESSASENRRLFKMAEDCDDPAHPGHAEIDHDRRLFMERFHSWEEAADLGEKIRALIAALEEKR